MGNSKIQQQNAYDIQSMALWYLDEAMKNPPSAPISSVVFVSSSEN